MLLENETAFFEGQGAFTRSPSNASGLLASCRFKAETKGKGVRRQKF